MAVPLISSDVQRQTAQVRETTSQAERRVQNEELLARVGETISGLSPIIAGTVAGVFSNVPFVGLATAFVGDKIKEARRDKAEKRRQRRLENRQRREAADILVRQGKATSKREALSLIDEGILKKAQKAEQQRQENLLANFDLSREEKDTEQQREENVQTERDNLETRVENAQIERETLDGMGEGLALESTVASIDDNISAIGDLILDRFADQEQNEVEQRRLQQQQLIQQREMRLEAERTQERVEEGEPEKVKDDKDSGLMRLLPMLFAGLTGLISLVGGVTGSLMGSAVKLGLGGVAAAATAATALRKPKVATPEKAPTDPKKAPTDPKKAPTEPKKAPTDPKKAPTEPKKPSGQLSKSQDTMGEKATNQSPKKGGIGDAIKKFKRVAKKVGFKRLALLIGKRVGTTVAAGLFTGPFAIIVGLIGLGLAVYEITSMLDEIEKEFDEGKSVDSETQEPVKDITADELARMSPEEAKAAGHIDFADQDDMNDRIEELRMKEQAQGEPERQADFYDIEDRAKAERIVASLITREGGKQNYEIEQAQDGSFNIYRVDSTPRDGEALSTASRQQTGQAPEANIVDARSTSSSVSTVNNNNTTVKSAPLNSQNQDMTHRYSSRYN